MTSEAQRWFDDAAGPVVRPYAMTRGRTRHASEAPLDLIALVITEEHVDAGDVESGVDQTLAPEHLEVLRRCRERPVSLAELATDLDLPVGVVRVLVGDLFEAGLVRVTRPVPPAELVDEQVLRDVINGLRSL